MLTVLDRYDQSPVATLASVEGVHFRKSVMLDADFETLDGNCGTDATASRLVPRRSSETP